MPEEIMRQQAPAVYEWVARLWNTRLETCPDDWLCGVPDDLESKIANSELEKNMAFQASEHVLELNAQRDAFKAAMP